MLPYFNSPIRAGGGLLLILSLISHALNAQEIGNDETTEINLTSEREIISLPNYEITGTRLEGPMVGVSVPVSLIDAKTLEFTTAKTVGELLHKQAYVFGRENYRGEQTPNPGGGEASIALRGLDATSTLVLLNGRRIASTSGLTTDGNFVNINTIPISAIEGIEVLRDGAASIYGSDALAGVVNIILKDKYEGSQATVTYGNTTSKDAGMVSADYTYGKSNGKTDLLLHTYYWDRNGIDSRDRELTKTADYRSLGGVDHRSFSSPEGLYFILDPFTYVYGKPGAAGDPANNVPPGYASALTGAAKYDFKEVGNELMPQTRYGLYANVGHKLGNDTRVFFQGLVNRIESESTLAAAPFSLSNARLGAPGEPLTPFFIPANHIHNPFGAAMDSDMAEIAKRMTELGPRIRESEVDSYHLTAGLETSMGAEWDLTTAITVSGEQTKEALYNIINKSALQQQLLVTDPTQTAFNLFSLPEYNLQPSQAAALEAVRLNTESRKRTTLYQWDAVARGHIGEINGSELETVLGVEARREEVNLRPDSNLITFNSFGATNQTGFRDSRHIFSAFGEVALPIIGETSPDYDGQRLTAIFSGRYEYYDDFGSTINPGLRISYQPIKELTFRAGIQRGFRAPSLESLHQQYAESYLYFSSKWTNTSYPVRVVRAANPDLDPEESLSWSAGVSWKPKGLSGLEVFADFFAIKVTDKIQVPDPAVYLSEFADQLDAGQDGNGIRFNRSSSLGAPLVGEVQIPYRNFGEQTARYLEVGAQWEREYENAGVFGVRVAHTHVLHYSEVTRPGGPRIESAGDFNTLIDQSVPRNKVAASLWWEWRKIELLTTLTWIEGVRERRGTASAKTDSWVSIDATVKYELTENTSLQLGVENVFDEQPPFSYAAGALGYDQRTYPIIGRNYAVSVTHRF